MLFYTYPAMVAAVAMATGHERITPWRGAALAIASAGVGSSSSAGSTRRRGCGSTRSACCWPLGRRVADGLRDDQPPRLQRRAGRDGDLSSSSSGRPSAPRWSAIATGSSASCLAPFGSLEPWPIILFAGILAAGLPSFLFLTAIRRIGGTRTGIRCSGSRWSGSCWRPLLLGERLGPIQVAGGAFVLAAAPILQRRVRPGGGADRRHVDIVEAAAAPRARPRPVRGWTSPAQTAPD